MKTRTLILLGAAIVAAILITALLAPRNHPASTGYVPARISVAPAAAVAQEPTPMPYQLPTLTPVQPAECGATTTVEYPDSTDEVTFDGFVTTNGYIKIVATLTDTGRSFTWPPTEGWQVNPIAPYRAEHLTQVVTTECAPEPEPPVTVPEPPVTVPEPAPPVTEPDPATHPEDPHAHDCRD